MSARMGQIIVRCGLLVATLVAWAPAAWAQPAPQAEADAPELKDGEYAPDNGDWNGLRDFLVLAESEGVTVNVVDTLDYDAITTDQPVIIVYPRQRLRSESLARFVIDGGYVLLADDFGESRDFLDRLDIERIAPLRGTLPHNEFLQNNPALPLVRARGVHPLLEDVQVVVANHPAVLYNVGGPVLAYSEDGGLVYDMNLGEGKAVVVADPSMLINHMLTLADNGQLWHNALGYLCEGQTPCTITMAVGDFEQVGAWGSDGGLLGGQEEVLESVSAFNDGLDSFMQDLPAEQLFYYLSILLAVGLGIYLYTIFPARQTRPYSAYVSDTQEKTHPPQSEFDWNLARFAQGPAAMNYALPVSILKEIFEELFLRELGFWEEDLDEDERGAGKDRPKIRELGDIFAERFLEDRHPPDEVRRIKGDLIDLLATFARVPTRHRVFLDSDTYFSERDLLKIHDRATHLLDIMGRRQAYERRTRSHF